MDKQPWESKTVWGGILLGLEAALLSLDIGGPFVKAAVAFLGIAITVWGFRDAMKK